MLILGNCMDDTQAMRRSVLIDKVYSSSRAIWKIQNRCFIFKFSDVCRFLTQFSVMHPSPVPHSWQHACTIMTWKFLMSWSARIDSYPLAAWILPHKPHSPTYHPTWSPGVITQRLLPLYFPCKNMSISCWHSQVDPNFQDSNLVKLSHTRNSWQRWHNPLTPWVIWTKHKHACQYLEGCQLWNFLDSKLCTC